MGTHSVPLRCSLLYFVGEIMLQRTRSPQSRLTFEITSLSLSEEQERQRMNDQGIRIGHWADEFLHDHYNSCSLPPGQRYQVRIFLANKVLKKEPRFIEKINKKLNSKKISAPYIKLAPRICEHLTALDFLELDLWRVVIPQASFVDDKKSRQALGVHCFPSNQDSQEIWLGTDTLSAHRQASDHCAFACITPLD